MKNQIIKMISLSLICVLFSTVLVSCGGLFEDREYTGGFKNGGGKRVGFEFCWLETYDECVDAIERLKSHGSTFTDYSTIISDDCELYDMKYCIIIDKSKVAEAENKSIISFKKHEGFDRKIADVEVFCYAFFEDVKIDDLIYSYIDDYKAYCITFDEEYAKEHGFNYEELTVDSLDCTKEEHPEASVVIYRYTSKEDNTKVFSVTPTDPEHEKPSDEMLQAIIDSIDTDSYKKMMDYTNE